MFNSNSVVLQQSADCSSHDNNHLTLDINPSSSSSSINSKLRKICIVGAGPAGLCAGIKLKIKLGEYISFTIFEEHDDVGGAWLANSYPGCCCDIESHLYSFSFEPNPFWSQHFATQSEIWEYFKNVARKYDLYSYIKFNTWIKSFVWDHNVAKWRIITIDKKNSLEIEEEFDIVINGPGGLRVPNFPDQFNSFKGLLIHSAKWNSEINLKDKIVGVVGSGASAIQLIPNIAPIVQQLHVFQRTPVYILPKLQFKYYKWVQTLFCYVPFIMWFYRCVLYLTHESFHSAFKSSSFINTLGSKISNWHMRRSVNDRLVQEKLKPSYKFGCKRLLLSNDFYLTFNFPHVQLNTGPVIAVNDDSVTILDGETIKIDVLILCTGFRVQDYFAPVQIFGKNHVNILDQWIKHGPRSFYGMICHEAPNHFILLGPNTGLGHNSTIFMIECQADFAVRVIRELIIKKKCDIVEITETAQDASMRAIEKEMKDMIWGTESCGSWYANKDGKITVLWPGSCTSYWFKRTWGQLPQSIVFPI